MLSLALIETRALNVRSQRLQMYDLEELWLFRSFLLTRSGTCRCSYIMPKMYYPTILEIKIEKQKYDRIIEVKGRLKPWNKNILNKIWFMKYHYIDLHVYDMKWRVIKYIYVLLGLVLFVWFGYICWYRKEIVQS